MYDGKTFRSVSNSSSGDVSSETAFRYHQQGKLVWGTYEGGSVCFGTLIAKMDDDGRLEMRYQHLSTDGELKTGECTSVPEELEDGRLRLHETWQWTCGSRATGSSVIEEVR